MVQTISKHQQAHEGLNLMFANHGKEDGIYRLTTIEIAKTQKNDCQIYSKKIQNIKIEFAFSTY
jgi:hypothetical protein